MMNDILKVVNLKKSYASVEAVKGIDLSIRQGSCFGLLGPNGAGKTTSIEIMEGIIPPDSGEILFRGKPIDKHFKQKVGIQFQSTSLPEFITVKETLELFRSFYPAPREMDDLIEICSLQDILDRDNRKLSGGQRQRMLLALAIIPRPEIVFLDEPTTGLDPQARMNFWDLIENIKKENATVLLTTHYMDEAQRLCDTIAIMDKGIILECAPPEELLDKHFEGVLVRVPHHGKISGTLPEGGIIVGDNLEIQTIVLDETLKDLQKCSWNLMGLSIHKPNLEDLFIKLTGSSLRS
jgi:ABC-2 type transport system ATP-binding protein